MTVDAQRQVSLGRREPQGDEVSHEATKRRPGGLLQAVQGPVKSTDMRAACRVGETRRLLAVDGLNKYDVEEGVVGDELMHRPIVGQVKHEDGAEGGRFENWAERLVAVNSGALSEAPRNATHFVPVQGIILLEFVVINPLA